MLNGNEKRKHKNSVRTATTTIKKVITFMKKYTYITMYVDYFLLCMQLMYIKMYVVSSLDLYYKIGMMDLACIILMSKIEIKSKSIFTKGNKRRCLCCWEVGVGIILIL